MQPRPSLRAGVVLAAALTLTVSSVLGCDGKGADSAAGSGSGDDSMSDPDSDDDDDDGSDGQSV